MAKIKGIYSTKLAGKVGSVVYRNTVNGNIVSEKASNVSNPRTMLQQIQRAIFNSVSQSYSILKSIDDHAFANVNTSAKNMAKFLAVNLPAVRSYIKSQGGIASSFDDMTDPIENAMGMVQKGAHIVPAIDNVIVVSKGDLDSAITNQWVLKYDSDNNKYQISWTANATEPEEEEGTYTYGQILKTLGIDAGDQLTVIAVCASGYETINGNTSSHRMNEAKLYKGYIIANPDIETTEVVTNENKEKLLLEQENIVISGRALSSFQPRLTLYTNDVPYMYAIIRSKKVDGVWQRSTEKLIYDNSFLGNNADPQNYYYPCTWQEVVESYDPNSEYYLNNAE